MKQSRFTEPQIMGILRQAEGGDYHVAGGAQIPFSGNSVPVEGLTAADPDADDFNFQANL